MEIGITRRQPAIRINRAILIPLPRSDGARFSSPADVGRERSIRIKTFTRR
jgi:hypothetical protein